MLKKAATAPGPFSELEPDAPPEAAEPKPAAVLETKSIAAKDSNDIIVQKPAQTPTTQP